jgi:biopolymer transport protein ExbD
MAELNIADKNSRKTRKKMSTRVDLTPMVDLGFLLITFFMLTTTFNKPQAMEVNMPKKTDDRRGDVKASKVLTLVMSDNDKVYYFRGIDNPVVDSTFSNDGLRTAILTAQQAVKTHWGDEKELIVLLKSQPEAKFRNLVDALDEMSITNVQRYAIATYNDNDALIINPLGKR